MSDEIVYIDAAGKVAGRLASIVAKKILGGSEVVVLNVEKAVITGRKNSIMEAFMKRLRLQSKINPRRHGPFMYRSPDGIFRKIVRGMLPRDKAKGRNAYRRLSVYVGIPRRFRGVKTMDVPEAKYRRSPYGYLSLEEISRMLGWKPVKEKIMGG